MQVKDQERKDDPLEVIRGEIRIGKELSDFQFLLREWFFTCYIVGVIIISTMKIVGLLLLKALMNHRRRQRILRQMREEQDDISEGLNLDESQLEGDLGNNHEWEDLPPMGEDTAEVGPDSDLPREEPVPSTPALNEEHSLAMDADEAPAENSDPQQVEHSN